VAQGRQWRKPVATVLREQGTSLLEECRGQFGPLETAALAARLELVRPVLTETLAALFGARAPDLAAEVLATAVRRAVQRPEPLRVLDRQREVDPSWLLSQRTIGYVCYVDLYAGTLLGLLEELDHLQELGVTYLHLMPLLLPRAGEDDGGYAVADYDRVDPRLGSMADLEAVALALHERGISLCVDLVLNHTADEHEWAKAALTGDPAYVYRYLSYPDREQPDAYERTLPEVFPDTSPGSFTWQPEAGRWFWTTFNSWQWDLDHSAPSTFCAMLEVMLQLLDRGVDVLRLDAVPFTWKRLGTDCQNQPEAHLLLQAFRALVRVAAPGALFKAEAIVAPDQLVQYLGGHDIQRAECDLAYHNQLMVLLWSTAATRDVGLAVHALRRLRRPPAGTGWMTYLRGHDDIGWAVSDTDAWAVGLDPRAHRRFLADFYAGRHPGSFARGADFQRNEATGEVRTSGTTASLCGLEQALEADDPVLLEDALRRFVLLHCVLYAYGGVPLLFSGDELAQRNDPDWAARRKAGRDSRWMHRPALDRAAATSRHDPGTVEARVFQALQQLGAQRAQLTALRSDGTVDVLDSGDSGVLALLRRHPRGHSLLVLANFSEHPRWVTAEVLDNRTVAVLASEPAPVVTPDGVELPGLGWAWLRREDEGD